MEAAKTFTDLCQIALRIIQKIPQPIGEVCGPITSGGHGSIEKNLAVFSAAIKKLTDQEKNIFDQVVFEDRMKKIWESKNRDNDALLREFYLPIFESGFIKTLYFLSDWQTSTGARWEHEQGKRLNIEIVYLPDDFVN